MILVFSLLSSEQDKVDWIKVQQQHRFVCVRLNNDDLCTFNLIVIFIFFRLSGKLLRSFSRRTSRSRTR